MSSIVDFFATARPRAVPRSVWVITIIAWWPFAAALAVALLPLFVSYYLIMNTVNFGRASKWQPLRATNLALATVGHMAFMIMHAPLFAAVAWYYVVVAPKDHVKKGVVYVTGPSPATQTQLCLDVYFMSRARRAATARANARGQAMRKSSLVAAAGALKHLTKDMLAAHGASSESSVTNAPESRSTIEADEVASASSSTGAAAHSPTSGTCRVPTSSSGTRRPVAIFIYGGAWGSGARWYYARLAASLRDATGAVVVVPDYAPYPECGIPGMVAAIHHTCAWVHDHIAKYGGDPHNVTIVGHSAGAQLAMMYALYRGLAAEGLDPSTGPIAGELAKLLPQPKLKMREPIPFLDCLPRWRFNHPPPHGATPADLLATLGSEPTGRGAARAIDESLSLPPIAGLVLFAGCYDIQTHVLTTETRRCVELISPASAAPCGFWGACSPTPLMRALLRTNKLGAVMRHVPANIDVYHPQLDTTVTMDQSEGLVELLNAGVAAMMRGDDDGEEVVNSGSTNTLHDNGTPQSPNTSGNSNTNNDDGRATTPGGNKANVVIDNALLGNATIQTVQHSARPSAGQSHAQAAAATEHTADATPQHVVHVMPGVGHADVIIGPMLSERPLHPTVIAIARAVLHKDHRRAARWAGEATS